MQRLLLTLGIPSKIRLSRAARGTWRALYRLCIAGHTFIDRLVTRIAPYSSKAVIHDIPSAGADKGWGYRPSLYTALTSRVERRGGYRLIERKVGMNETTGYGALAALMEHPHASIAAHAEELTHCVQVTLKSVTPTDLAETYDIEVEGIHLLCSNGLYASNTRRAAKMVILDVDHPDVVDFIASKEKEEKKAWALIDAGYSGAFNVPGGAYDSVQFQNANHSVRVTDAFMSANAQDGDWQTRFVLSREAAGTYKARELMKMIGESAWVCGDPGMQYDTTINRWHTCKTTDKIYASNPCSEFMFLNDTACFAPETRISTPNGLRTIETLYEDQERGESVCITTDLYSEQDHRRLTAHRQAFVTKVGQRQVFRMMLKDGRSIRVTGDHRFLTDAGQWKRVDELRVGEDRVQIRQSGNAISFTSSVREVQRWRMLGWLTGDGVFSKGNVALVFGPRESESARVMEAEFNTLLAEAYAWSVEEKESELPLVPARIAAVPRGGAHISLQRSGVMQITSKSQALVRFLEKQYAMKQATAMDKEVPGALHRADDDLKVAYLQGLFSADGYIRRSATEEEVMLASSSAPLLRSVQLLLSDIGITSRITRRHPRGRKNPQGQLHIYNQQARAFLTLIGFPCSEAKDLRARAILSRPFQGARKNPRPARVISITPDGVTTVYDLTEPATHSVVAEGMIAHNCNLASINLMRFRTEDGEFDVEAFKHACRTLITAQEIIVDNASYPTPRIAENSHDYRPLGLGYANLGALLMARGVPYDSDAGRAYAGAITAIITGEAYHQSGIIARDHGWPFPGYQKNRASFLEVMRMHRAAVEEINPEYVPDTMLQGARRCWDDAIAQGEKHGYRNAQATVIAPTGTISFLMDADTTGIEPDIAIVKYKSLVGGGVLKIVNNTVPEALRRLGYDQKQVDAILSYIDQNDTIEGAPELKPEHLPVFDCAFKPSNGTRSIHYMGHVKMMAAAQPFISGAISKTVNLPNEATPDDIVGVYEEGWKLGLKAIAIYRDGSKRTQPLSTKKADVEETKREDAAGVSSVVPLPNTQHPTPATAKPLRRKLPDERQSITHKFSIAGHEGYITVGMYPEGAPGEIFLTMSKEGSTISGLMDSFATAISLALQYGVPLQTLVDKFAHTRFEPSGITNNADIRFAKSIMDYIFRWLGTKFLNRQPEGEPSLSGPAGEENGAHGEAKLSLPAPRLTLTTGGNDRELSLAEQERETFQNQADAPICTECGSLMVRNGACFKCLNCGSVFGCS
jgi:ribonucleoside-diphosphate reductase alpha chain